MPAPTEVTDGVHPVDQLRPVHKLIPFAIQHVLVMVATPISAVFLITKALELPQDMTSALLSAVLVFSGLGSILQSVGVWKLGVRLPFVMLPGGAGTVLFISIGQGTDLQTAVGAVILTGVFYILAVTLFVRVLKYFPPLVIGVIVIVIGINLIQVTGKLITGQPDSPEFGDPRNLLLGFVTIAATVLCFRFLPGIWGRLSIAIGLVAGTVVGAFLGMTSFGDQLAGPLVAAPTLFPFGMPKFDLIAAIPMLLWALASMAEATGQTIINGEIVERKVTPSRDVPRVVRADGIITLLGGLFGCTPMVTSGENVGIVRASGVRSRFVTAIAGIILILIGFSPLARVLGGIPAAAVGGTAVVVFAIIAVLGVQMLSRVDFHHTGNLITATVGLGVGLLPVLIPGMYSRFPPSVASLLSSGVAMSAFTAVVLNLLFNHGRRKDSDAEATSQKPSPTSEARGTAE
ncbi:uracil-xanthine permease [Brevibacterium sanguinis]|uniref:Uracil-xanthine permease n=2 Tax=Brevibacterium TaxID=1696 RepID=A0A366IGA7_9MICO|nr:MULTISPECIES: uracil-xanthine permease family protein [Brevibacterium]RBP61970.1 uracil-xanthine permease [Brevibacterium sanguinis]RBP70608.1 uracil-xanthine permease [Brevibacterium celere]